MRDNEILLPFRLVCWLLTISGFSVLEDRIGVFDLFIAAPSMPNYMKSAPPVVGQCLISPHDQTHSKRNRLPLHFPNAEFRKKMKQLAPHNGAFISFVTLICKSASTTFPTFGPV